MATPPVFSAGAVLTAAQMNAVGLWLVTPSSVAGSGVTLSGAIVTGSASSTISVNGCFTSDFLNYVVHWNGLSSNNDVTLQIRLRAGGTDTSTGTVYRYTTQQQYVGIANVGVSGSNGANQINMGGTSNAETGYEWSVFNPRVAKNTVLQGQGVNNQAAFGNGIDAYRFQSFVQNSTQYDGFTIFPSAGTLSGTLAVYGVRR